MKVLAIFLVALALTQAAEARKFKGWLPRSVLYPRDPVPQGPGYFAPTKMAPSHKAFCGAQVAAHEDKIVGGSEAVPGEFPWQVAITIDGLYFCGGSMIDSTHVLTAAHCADGARSFEVTFGAHNINQNEPSQISEASTDYTIHPNWNPNTLSGDMAIIRLKNAVPLTPRIQPICLVSSNAPNYVDADLVVSGWGKTQDVGGGISPVLNKATVVGITTAECAAVYGSIISDDILCVKTSVYNQGPCNGDSGGPLSFVDGQGVYNQVGLVSFGSRLCLNSGNPDGFTRISSYTQWISDNTGLIL